MKINLNIPSEDPRIEILPLINVIFCILGFFLLASFLPRQAGLNLDPSKPNSGLTVNRDMLIVSIDELEQIYVEKQLMASREQFEEYLKNYHLTNPNGLMLLYAAGNLSYTDVTKVLDLMRSIGGDRVAVATLPSTSPTQPINPQLEPTPNIPGTAPNIPPNPNFNGAPNPNNPVNITPPFPGNPSQLPPQPGINPAPPFPGNPNQLPPQPGINPAPPFPGNPNQLPPQPGINPVNPNGLPVAPGAPIPEATTQPPANSNR